MIACQRVGEDRLAERAQRGALADVNAVNRALLRRVTNADISVARCRGRAVGRHGAGCQAVRQIGRSEEHTSELPSLMRTSYAVFCLKHKNPLQDATLVAGDVDAPT